MHDATSPRAASVVAGRYVLGDTIGQGGMSTVYKAEDRVLGRTVALKILASTSADPVLMKREQTEIALLASLNHHALVTLYDAKVAWIDGSERSYLAMEFVGGPTLEEHLLHHRVHPSDAARMLTDLSEALHVVHRAGIVHRDIKPGNILLAPSQLPGRAFSAKLSDFGIASLIDSTRITAVGTVMGTAAYLSPEQARGARVGPASDVYSLGLVLLEALKGEREFPGTMMESLSARMTRDPVIPESVGVEWASLLAAMTSRDPASRPTAEAVLERAETLVPSNGEPRATADLSVPLRPSASSAAGSEPHGAATQEPARAPRALLPRSRRRRLRAVLVAASFSVVLLLAAALAMASGFRVDAPVADPGRAATSSPSRSPEESAAPPASTAPASPSEVSTTTRESPAPVTSAVPAPGVDVVPEPATTAATAPVSTSVAEPVAPVAPVPVPAPEPVPTAVPVAPSPAASAIPTTQPVPAGKGHGASGGTGAGHGKGQGAGSGGGKKK